MVRISTHTVLLVLIFAFLVCEIVVGQICRSLLIAVDSFHTLYVFINMALSALKHQTNASCTPEASREVPDPVYDVRMRLQPFCILISALLLASQCVSISLEVLTHLVQPEAIQHPHLCIVVGGVSVLFNTLVLLWRRRAMDDGTQNKMRSASEPKESALPDGALMFCNPQTSSVLDPNQTSPDGSSSCQNTNVTESKHTQTSQSSIGEAPQKIPEPIEKPPEEQKHTAPQCVSQVSIFREHHLGLLSIVQDLLCSVLVLSNGLVLLLSRAHCHRPHSDCHLLVYLDAVFSTVCVVFLLSAALPRLHRYGLLVLQAAPLHLSVRQVRLCLGQVPGVLSVHELHIWQLSDSLIIASLHVHCPAGMSAAECEELIANIKAVFYSFGVNHCTVQPEFLTPEKSEAAPAEGSGRPGCSLRCGQECVEKLCCAPQVDESTKTINPTCIREEKPCDRDVVIENTSVIQD
ncbi:proton-coupled zinc antiporter SLC30A1 [Danio rerio]|uniref:Zinc/cadmium resistance protein-like n=2 Tax=Danio rerio TaxID=7955 RepID=E7FCR4_DANRE|nr:zinc/cadmium resistance protein-like [Danio rerio]|eukprot:XP_009292164.1 zinc/cadmium resistance protein-like [Danio rerio]